MTKKLTSTQKKSFNDAMQKCEFKNVDELKITFTKWHEVILKSRTEEEATFAFFQKMPPQTINEILCLGIHESFVSGNYSTLLNSLYTHNHLLLSKKERLNLVQHTGGYDCTHVFPIIFAYAGNNLKIVQRYLLKYPDFSTKGAPFTKILCNLVVSIIKEDIEAKTVYLEKANHSLKLKNTKYDEALLTCLIGIIDSNADTISKGLESAVKLYSKARYLHDFFNDLNKFVAIQLFGIVSIAYHHLPHSIFKKISTPIHFSWSDEFFTLNCESSYSEGTDFLLFDKNLKFVQEEINKYK